MPGEKVAPGQRVASSPLREAQTVNDLLDLLYRHKSGQLSGLGRTDQPPPLGTDFVVVRNDSGTDRERGEVLQLATYLLTTDDEADNKWNHWLAGDEAADPLWKCVILHEPIKSEAIGKAHATGVCVGKVDVLDVEHTHAKFVDASYVLESATSGPIELLSPADGTGEQLMVVRFATPATPHPILLVEMTQVTDVLTGGQSATVNTGQRLAFTDPSGLEFINSDETDYDPDAVAREIIIKQPGVYRVCFQCSNVKTDSGDAIYRFNGNVSANGDVWGWASLPTISLTFANPGDWEDYTMTIGHRTPICIESFFWLEAGETDVALAVYVQGSGTCASEKAFLIIERVSD